ncbi:hypothetical protein PYCC9005_000745 [Savitreella phatthalungensis]
MTDGVRDRIAQLDQAKALVRSNVAYLQQILVGVLPIALQPDPELREWIADFLLWAINDLGLDSAAAQTTSIAVLPTLVQSLSNRSPSKVLRKFVQVATCVQPFVFTYLLDNAHDTISFGHWRDVKRVILQNWDDGDHGVRISCIKFAQRVIVLQTNGTRDPRLAAKAETSLASVPSGHALLQVADLAAEAQGLLDRLCSVATEMVTEITVMTAAINCLTTIARSRVLLAAKIATELLASANEREASVADSLKERWFTKTVRCAFAHLLRHNVAGSLGPKIQSYLVRQAQRSADDEISKKRGAPEEPVGLVSSSKRSRTTEDRATPVPSMLSVPPLPTGHVALKDVFNLSHAHSLASFDVNTLPHDVAMKLVLAALALVDQDTLHASIVITEARVAASERQSALEPERRPPEGPVSSTTSDPSKTITRSWTMPEPEDLEKSGAIELAEKLEAGILSMTDAVPRDAWSTQFSGPGYDRDVHFGRDRFSIAQLGIRLAIVANTDASEEAIGLLHAVFSLSQ